MSRTGLSGHAVMKIAADNGWVRSNGAWQHPQHGEARQQTYKTPWILTRPDGSRRAFVRLIDIVRSMEEAE